MDFLTGSIPVVQPSESSTTAERERSPGFDDVLRDQEDMPGIHIWITLDPGPEDRSAEKEDAVVRGRLALLFGVAGAVGFLAALMAFVFLGFPAEKFGIAVSATGATMLAFVVQRFFRSRMKRDE